jgi:hypothetical protein
VERFDNNICGIFLIRPAPFADDLKPFLVRSEFTETMMHYSTSGRLRGLPFHIKKGIYK